MVLRVEIGKGHFFDNLITSQILLTSTMMSSYMWWRSWADSVKVWELRSWYRDQWSAALFRAVELSTTQILLFLPPAKRMVLLLGNDLYYSKLELDCKEDSPVQQSFANDSDHTSSLQRGRSNMTILQNDPDLRTPYKVEDPIWQFLANDLGHPRSLLREQSGIIIILQMIRIVRIYKLLAKWSFQHKCELPC